ncbi:unnamed protein product [Prunus armeniaca]
MMQSLLCIAAEDEAFLAFDREMDAFSILIERRVFLADLVSRSGILRRGYHWLEEAYVSGRLNWMLLPKKSKRS